MSLIKNGTLKAHTKPERGFIQLCLMKKKQETKLKRLKRLNAKRI